MKRIALAAALAIGAPAFAQAAPQSTTTTTTTTVTTAAEPAPDGAAPLGGYAPPSPYPDGTPSPGATVIFVPSSQTPSQAFPPPAPLDHYPVCKRGQTDKCVQRGGR